MHIRANSKIFNRAAEGRLRAAEARANSGGDDSEKVKEVEEALEEFNEYAEFGKEISSLAEGLQTGDTTVEELVERATSHHLDILQSVRSKVPAEAQDGIQKAIDNAGRVQETTTQKERLYTALFVASTIILRIRWAVYCRPKLGRMPLHQLLMLCKFLTERSCS